MNKNKKRVFGRALIPCGIVVTLAAGFAAVSAQSEGAQTAATGPADYDLSWYTVDGGGAMFHSGGDYELSGTIGQPDAGGPMVGPAESGYELTGGFWFPLVAGDCNTDGGVNLFDYDAFKACLAGPAVGPLSPECVCYDLDHDNDLDLFDFALFQSGFSGS